MRDMLKVAISMSLSFPWAALSADFTLNRYLTAREVEDDDGTLDRIGYLAPGAIVRVPQTKIAEEFGETDPTEAQMLSWLKRSGEIRSFRTKSGVKKDFFFPVEIVDPGRSKGLKVGDTTMVSIRYLVRQNGLSLKVSDQLAERVRVRKVVKQLQTAIEQLENKTKRNIENRENPFSGVNAFESNCAISFKDFKAELEEVTFRERIPAELMLSIMHIESTGDCNALLQEHNGSYSVGLFQVNTRTSRVDRCDDWQKEQLKSATSIEKLHDAKLNCLENPIVNLTEAVSILRKKYSSVNSQGQPPIGKWSELSQTERNQWRKALAAYNGGQAYVIQAHRDIQSFNRKHGASVDSNDWEMRRIFFLRRFLSAKAQKANFDRSMKFRRSGQRAILNLAYVESVAGRETKVGPESPLVRKWERTLYPQQIAMTQEETAL